MNVIFLTLLDFKSIKEKNIYTDLLREFVKRGDNVYVISPIEKRKNTDTYLLKEDGAVILKLKIGNIQKTKIIEKGISMLLIESQFIRGIKKYFYNIKFDLILYSTPPITFYSAIKYLKIRDEAKTYLLLKDIFPQNAIDMGLLSKTGIKGILYNYFRKKEKKLYNISDKIGCMSQANIDYILKYNSEVKKDKLEICPNSIEVVDKSIEKKLKIKIRNKYSIPLDKKIFVYGGNLGKPQGISFLINCLENQKNNKELFFLIIGDGTEYLKLKKYLNKNKLLNVKLMQRLPKEEYDILVGACDIGLIFLDYRFTIPNFPSRLLGYMQAKIPVLACTDVNTDIGKIIVEGGFGWWCPSYSVNEFEKLISKILCSNLEVMKSKEYEYLDKFFNVEVCYQVINNTYQRLRLK